MPMLCIECVQKVTRLECSLLYDYFQIRCSIQASPNKSTGRYSDYWHSRHVTLRIHSTLGIGAFDTLFPLLGTLDVNQNHIQWYGCKDHLSVLQSPTKTSVQKFADKECIAILSVGPSKFVSFSQQQLEQVTLVSVTIGGAQVAAEFSLTIQQPSLYTSVLLRQSLVTSVVVLLYDITDLIPHWLRALWLQYNEHHTYDIIIITYCTL